MHTKPKSRRSTRRSNTKSRTKRGSSSGHGFHLPKEGRVTVYGQATCIWCQKMKQHLRPNHDAYVELTPNLMPAFRKHIAHRIQGHTSIPLVFVGTKFIGGYDNYLNYSGNVKQ